MDALMFFKELNRMCNFSKCGNYLIHGMNRVCCDSTEKT